MEFGRVGGFEGVKVGEEEDGDGGEDDPVFPIEV